MLLTLRFPEQDIGTMELVRVTIGPGESAWQLPSIHRVQEPTGSVLPSEDGPTMKETRSREASSTKDWYRKRMRNRMSTSHHTKRRRIRTQECTTGLTSEEL
jgi:hypothetical protein